MREITIYEADDGTRFADRDDCVMYEERQKIPSYKDAVDAFDARYKYLDLEKLSLDFWANDAAVLRIKDPEGAKKLFDYAQDMYGYEWPGKVKAGEIWIYDDGWTDFSLEVKEKQRKLNMIRNLVCE